MDKLKEYILHPKIEPQGDFLPLPSSNNEISDVEDTENEEEENDQSFPIYYINAINIKPSADKDESDNEEQIKPQSYIPQDPLLHPGPEEIFSPMHFKPQIIIPSPPPSQQIKDRSLSLTPSTADEAEEGILGEKVYESATYAPEEHLTFKPIPAEANENSTKTFLQRIRSLFS
uniref:Uncharacterized protein n=1 Tax=Panagrolaimus sp. PS1159 TaxID=55785 RepID=A0AC35G6Q8_9BILA